jgi:hypothetical protein
MVNIHTHGNIRTMKKKKGKRDTAIEEGHNYLTKWSEESSQMK